MRDSDKIYARLSQSFMMPSYARFLTQRHRHTIGAQLTSIQRPSAF